MKHTKESLMELVWANEEILEAALTTGRMWIFVGDLMKKIKEKNA